MPAAIAFCRAVYCLSPVPALTSSMSTLGYFFSKSSATFFRVGSHAHTVTFPPFSNAAATSFGPPLPAPASGASEPQAVVVSESVASTASAPSSLRVVCVRIRGAPGERFGEGEGAGGEAQGLRP